MSTPFSAHRGEDSGRITPAGFSTVPVDPAVLTSGAAQPYALADDGRLTLRVNGGATQTILFDPVDFANIAAATAAEVAAVIQSQVPPARMLSGATGPYSLTDGDTLTVRVDGGAEQIALFQTGDFVNIAAATAAEVAAVINADVTGLTASATTAQRVLLTSSSTGPAASLEVTGGTANVDLAFPASPEVGSDPVTASAVSSRVQIRTVVVGDAASLEITGGSANAALQFPMGTFLGESGAFVYCLGSDTPGRFYDFKNGDMLTLSQVNDPGGDKLLRYTGRTRGALAMPGDAAWKISVLVDGAARVVRTLETGRRIRDLRDMGANLAGLAVGNHTIGFRLEFVTSATSVLTAELPAFYVEAVRISPS